MDSLNGSCVMWLLVCSNDCYVVALSEVTSYPVVLSRNPLHAYKFFTKKEADKARLASPVASKVVSCSFTYQVGNKEN